MEGKTNAAPKICDKLWREIRAVTNFNRKFNNFHKKKKKKIHWNWGKSEPGKIRKRKLVNYNTIGEPWDYVLPRGTQRNWYVSTDDHFSSETISRFKKEKKKKKERKISRWKNATSQQERTNIRALKALLRRQLSHEKKAKFYKKANAGSIGSETSRWNVLFLRHFKRINCAPRAFHCLNFSLHFTSTTQQENVPF